MIGGVLDEANFATSIDSELRFQDEAEKHVDLDVWIP